MSKSVLALIRSCHPGPSLVVAAVAAILGIALGYTPGRLVVLTLAVLAGQLSIGWSNDWLDAGRDAAVHREDKPTARGEISPAAVRNAAAAAVVATLVLSVMLGPLALAVHVVAVAMGWAYNIGLKTTAISVVPYLISFGLLPAVATLGQVHPHFAAGWVVAAGALLGAAAHFTNVLPDLADDQQTGIRGLPHRLGGRPSGLIAFACVAATAIILTAAPSPAPTLVRAAGLMIGLAVAVVGVVLLYRRTPTRLLMRLIMACALIDVALLAVAGQSIAA